jgi:uncharacterized protein YegP (UPF0339 family)
MVYEDYLRWNGYESKEAHASEAGFSAFYHEESQRHFFAVLDATGNVLLKSEGYPQQAARENGIQSVIRNRDNADFYSVKVYENGRYYISLRAANHREIARSCSFLTEAEALAEMPYVKGAKVRSVVTATAAVAEATKERADNADGIVKFANDNGQYYFAWVDASGDVIMRSEGYPTKSARDNGANSVVKNRDNEDRYAGFEKMGRYFTILKAGNHQEIARSCPFNSAAEAGRLYPSARAGAGRASFVATEALEAEAVTISSPTHDSVAITAETTGATETFVSEATTIVESAADAGVASTVGTTVVEAASFAAAATVATAVTMTSETTSTSSTSGTSTHAEPTEEADVEDDYLPCKEYAGHKINDKVNNVAMFKHDNGQFYFAIYNADGSVRLRSEGFRTAQDRDKELSGALKNLNNAAMYSTMRRGNYSMSVLKDATGREVGRGCLEKDAPAVAAAAPIAVAVAAAAAAFTPPTPPVAAADVEDDYLVCKEYADHKINDKVNNVAMFKHHNGQYYFAIYHADGSVRLRSEGFKTSQDRDKELSGALRNLNNAAMYATVRRGDHWLSILKDATGREVGRSCLQKDNYPHGYCCCRRRCCGCCRCDDYGRAA